MKNIGIATAILFMVLIILDTPSAVSYEYLDDNSNPGHEQDLYEIFNTVFDTDYTSSDHIYYDCGLADEDDDQWHEIGSGHISITVRYAGYEQELGIIDTSGTYYTIAADIPKGFSNIQALLPIPDDFVFVEKLGGKGSGTGPWYSDDRNSENVDHFMAFDVTELYRKKFSSDVDRAWFIAFEDGPDGADFDYNDLICVVADVEPTLIELSSFTAVPFSNKVMINWSTASEVDCVGFNMYRAESSDGDYRKINEAVIPCTGSPVSGDSYLFIDESAVNRKTYFYRLEDIDRFGETTLHRPVQATPRFIFALLQGLASYR